MHGVVALLDEHHCQLVKDLWGEIRSQLDIKGVYVTPYPHFSFHVAEHYEIELLEPILADFAAQTKPFEAQTTGLGIFTGGLSPVVYINVVRSPQLTHLHELLWPQLEEVSAGIVAYYHPQQWVPHITLGYGDITPAKLPAVIELLSRYQFDWRISIDTIALLYADASAMKDETKLHFKLNAEQS